MAKDEEKLKKLREEIHFLRCTLVGLEDCSDVRIMRKDLQKKEEEYMDLISSSHTQNRSEEFPTREDEKEIKKVKDILTRKN